MEIAEERNENEDNAEGAVWNGNMNGNQGVHHNILPSQMAAANGAVAAVGVQETTGNDQNKQVRVVK